MLDDPKGYYARLGVPSSATAEVLKSAFRQRAKSLHPDNPVSGSEDGFRRLMEAYDVLGDASARARYDDEVRRARPRATAPRADVPRRSYAKMSTSPSETSGACCARGPARAGLFRQSVADHPRQMHKSRKTATLSTTTVTAHA